jgi:hypothetical protein
MAREDVEPGFGRDCGISALKSVKNRFPGGVAGFGFWKKRRRKTRRFSLPKKVLWDC